MFGWVSGPASMSSYRIIARSGVHSLVQLFAVLQGHTMRLRKCLRCTSAHASIVGYGRRQRLQRSPRPKLERKEGPHFKQRTQMILKQTKHKDIYVTVNYTITSSLNWQPVAAWSGRGIVLSAIFKPDGIRHLERDRLRRWYFQILPPFAFL